MNTQGILLSCLNPKLSNWVKRAQKKSKLNKDVREKKTKETAVPSFKELIRIPLNNLDVVELTKSQCFRPDLFLDNGRHCEGCPFYKDCNLSLKCLPKRIMFDGEKFIEKHR